MNNKKKTLIVSFISSEGLVGKWTADMAGEPMVDITALASLWHNTDKWTIHMGWSGADAQLITTSLIAHRSGSFPGVRSKWSEASDFRQTLPNAAEGPARRCVGTQQWGYGCTCVASFSRSTKHTPMAIYQQRRRDTYRPGSKAFSLNKAWVPSQSLDRCATDHSTNLLSVKTGDMGTGGLNDAVAFISYAQQQWECLSIIQHTLHEYEGLSRRRRRRPVIQAWLYISLIWSDLCTGAEQTEWHW